MFLFSYLFAGMMPIYISGGGRKRGVISGSGATGIGSGGATRTEVGSAQNKVSGTLSYQHGSAPQHQVSCFKLCFLSAFLACMMCLEYVFHLFLLPLFCCNCISSICYVCNFRYVVSFKCKYTWALCILTFADYVILR